MLNLDTFKVQARGLTLCDGFVVESCPGKGGQSFDPGTIASLRAWYALDPTGLVDGQIIDTVSDRSGEGAEGLTQSSASLQPTYDAATNGWETSATGGCVVGASFTDWKFLHVGAASITSRVQIDPAQTAWIVNTLWGPHTGRSGVWIYWKPSSMQWVIRIGGRQYIATPSVSPSAGVMHTLTFSWDALGGVTVYQDGVLVASASASPLFSALDQASVLVVGAGYFTGTQSSDQLVVHLLLFDEPLDAAQALAIHTGLVAYSA